MTVTVQHEHRTAGGLGTVTVTSLGYLLLTEQLYQVTVTGQWPAWLTGLAWPVTVTSLGYLLLRNGFTR